jgi:hypothetical protein
MHSRSKRDGLFSSLTLATVLAAGLLAAVGLIFAVAAYFLAFQSDGSYQSLSFTVEGEPVLVTDYRDGLRRSEYRTLDGALIEDRNSIDLQNNHVEIQPANYELGIADDWIWRVSGFQNPGPTSNYWYLVQEDPSTGKAYFVGYHPNSRQQIGFLGRSGFRSEKPPIEEQFDLPQRLLVQAGLAPLARSRGDQPTSYDKDWPQQYLIDDGGLRRIDLTRQSVASVPLSGRAIALGQYDQLTAVADDRRTTSEPRLVVRLPEALQIMSTAAKPIRSIELSEPMRDKMIKVLGTTVGEIILETSAPYDHYAPHDVYWIGADGQVLRHKVVDIWKRPEPDGSLPYWVISAVVPVPLLLAAMTLLDAGSHRHPRSQIDFTQRLTEILGNGWLPFLFVGIVCLALAVYTYRRQRKYDPSVAWAWGAFVFLLGPLGLAGYFLSRQWPPVISCEVCGKPAPRDRAICRHCAEAFPPAKLKEIEVFA